MGAPKVIEIKCAQVYFREIWGDLNKTFEVRKDDRDYQSGDVVVLREVDAAGFYTPRSTIFRIGYVLRDFPGLRRGWCAFSLLEPDDEALRLALAVQGETP